MGAHARTQVPNPSPPAATHAPTKHFPGPPKPAHPNQTFPSPLHCHSLGAGPGRAASAAATPCTLRLPHKSMLRLGHVWLGADRAAPRPRALPLLLLHQLLRARAIPAVICAGACMHAPSRSLLGCLAWAGRGGPVPRSTFQGNSSPGAGASSRLPCSWHCDVSARTACRHGRQTAAGLPAPHPVGTPGPRRRPCLPSRLGQGRVHWTGPLIRKLVGDVKLMGPTISCKGTPLNGDMHGEWRTNPHVQSYVVAADQVTARGMQA